jgi:hypothetical protein
MRTDQSIFILGGLDPKGPAPQAHMIGMWILTYADFNLRLLLLALANGLGR